MKITEIKSLSIEAVKVIRFARFCDHRGFFTEHYRKSDFDNHPEMNFLKQTDFVQFNESYSKAGTIRGLHFQWNPYMGKLVRTVKGRMVDMVLDIRKGSPTFGKILLYNMPVDVDQQYSEWIWVPPGFAHGNFFSEESMIEYLCTGQYSPGCEAGISPLSKDLDWSVCDENLKKEFMELAEATELMTDKDRNGYSLDEWIGNENSEHFKYGQL